MLLTPLPPVTNCHTFSDPLPPLERDVLYGRPLKIYRTLTTDAEILQFHIKQIKSRKDYISYRPEGQSASQEISH